jgi:hypothetical protein
MNTQDFTVVFDITQNDYLRWLLPGVGLVGIVLIALFAVLFVVGLKAGSSKGTRWMSLGTVSLLIFWVVSTFLSVTNNYEATVGLLRAGRASYVEGVVQNFVPMPFTGHAVESFQVNGIPFSYSDYVSTAGFNNTSSHGGPIRSGLYVRVWYSGNTILKLEIPRSG